MGPWICLRGISSPCVYLCLSSDGGIGCQTGDGVVFQIVKPNKNCIDSGAASFFTREGYYAYGAQAFVDHRRWFVSLAMNFCGSTHDRIAYICTAMSDAIKSGRLPSWAHVVLDEAYPCTEQELSPFRGKHLNEWQDSFNYHLSLHRQVVKRAFGMLKQRWEADSGCVS